VIETVFLMAVLIGLVAPFIIAMVKVVLAAKQEKLADEDLAAFLTENLEKINKELEAMGSKLRVIVVEEASPVFGQKDENEKNTNSYIR